MASHTRTAIQITHKMIGTAQKTIKTVISNHQTTTIKTKITVKIITITIDRRKISGTITKTINTYHEETTNQVNMEVVEETRAGTSTENTDQITHAVNNIPVNGKTINPYIHCQIENEEIQLLVDTGATISVLTKEIVDKIIQNIN